MATIVTRAGKGSALTWTEGDANITNLNTSKIENLVEDTTPQLGGSLDVNGNSIISASNGNINIVPNGSGNIALTPATGKIILGACDWPTSSGSANQVLTTSGGTGVLSWTTITSGIDSVSITDSSSNAGTWQIPFIASGPASFTGVSVDGQLTYVPSTNILTANLNGALNGTVGATTANTGAFTTLSASTSVSFSPSGAITLNPTTAGTINNMSIGATTATTGRFTTITSTIATGTAPFTVASTTNVANLNASSLGGATFASPGAIGSTTASTGAFTTLSASSTVSGTGFSTYLASPPAIGGTSAAAGSFTDLSSTGKLTFKQPIEAVYSLGTTGGTIAPNAANGSVQTITLNAALTINAFTSPVAGQSITLIITGGTAYTSITSTMKFAGGVKTLTGTAGCIDILSIYYDGTNYFASLGKGYA
ncbi:hypothetical protein UFOVP647_6 [uncultured Caudovirales phage]|uniref:Major tropism determinant N-terminal domain-containing protein n=1 Tax=uncultured Caudovirales phage TaxID=2100421 RepID=A0A6J5N4N8_9CAUD|nr:hypothetical protein UFOVP647_6 [uncultured Caudovirales phage]